MHARPRSIAALVVALVATAVALLVMVGSAPASAAPCQPSCRPPRPRPARSPHPATTTRSTSRAVCATPARRPPGPGARRQDQRRGRRPARSSARAPATTPASSTSPCPGTSIDVLGNTYTVKIDKDSLPEGAAPAQPQAGLARRSRRSSTPTCSSPSRSATPTRGRHRQGHPGPAARGRRPGLRAAARDGGARPVDDLRHDGPDELRARRADHLRRAGRLRRRLAAGHDPRSAAPTSPSRWRSWSPRSPRRGLRVAQRPRPVGAAAAPRHRPGRDDGRQHRPVDPAAQRLPVLRRREHPPVLPVLQPASVALGTGRW